VQDNGRHADRGRETGVEGGELEFLVEHRHERKISQEHDSHRPKCLRAKVTAKQFEAVEWDIGDFAVEHGVDIDVHC
jgi:hypothetical protein